jgi:uncharacterized protein (DUF1697 family)
MPRFAALLRAINVGGHTVKMDALRQLFSGLGFDRVETLIASGNVLFDSPQGPAELEPLIEATLQTALGFEVATFLRTHPELAAVVNASETIEAPTVSVAFARAPLDTTAHERLSALRNPYDDFLVSGRDLFWLCQGRVSGSKLSGAVLEKTVGTRLTIRNITTVRKLADLLSPGGLTP